jgi:hypothetical protein
MNESLKSARFLYNLLVLACAAIIIFAFTPDQARRYSAAEHELAQYSRLSSNDYFEYVYSSLKQDEQKEKTQMVEMLRQNGYRVADEVFFIVPMWADTINAGRSLGTFCLLTEREQTITFARVIQDYPGPLRPLDASSPALKVNSTDIVTAINLGSEPDMNPALKFQLLNGKPTGFPVSSSLILSIRRQDGEQILSSLRVAYISGTSKTGYFGKDWLKSLPYAFHLVEGNRCLPNSLQIYPEISRMQPVDAMRYLASRNEAEKKNDLEVSSLRIDSETAIWAAPVIVGLLLLFFLSHLRQLRRISKEEKCIMDFPWVGIFSDWLGQVIAYGTILVLPVLSDILLTYRVAPASRFIRLGPPIFIALFSIWACIELWRLRVSMNAPDFTSSDC